MFETLIGFWTILHYHHADMNKNVEKDCYNIIVPKWLEWGKPESRIRKNFVRAFRKKFSSTFVLIQQRGFVLDQKKMEKKTKEWKRSTRVLMLRPSTVSDSYLYLRMFSLYNARHFHMTSEDLSSYYYLATVQLEGPYNGRYFLQISVIVFCCALIKFSDKAASDGVFFSFRKAEKLQVKCSFINGRDGEVDCDIRTKEALTESSLMIHFVIKPTLMMMEGCDGSTLKIEKIRERLHFDVAIPGKYWFSDWDKRN